MATASTNPVPTSWALALLAGAAALLGVPLGAVGYLARVGLGAVNDAWVEGGWPMYGVVGAAMVSSLILAALITAATRASTGVAVALPVLSGLPALAGAAGAKWGMDGALAAVAHASPADRATILFGSAGEALQASRFGAAMSCGLALGVGLGLFVGWRARAKDAAPAQRDALLAGALVALTFAVVCAAGAEAIIELAGVCKAIAHLGPSLQELVQPMVAELSGMQRVWTGSLLAALIAIFVGAGVVRAPLAGRVAFGVSALLGLSLLGLGTRPQVPANFAEANTEGTVEPELLRFDAPPLGGAGLLLYKDSEHPTLDDLERTQGHVRVAHANWRDLHSYAGDDAATFGLNLGKELPAETLAAALEVLCEEGVRGVILFTSPTTKPVSDLPPPFDALPPPTRGVRVELGLQSEQCPDGCELARLENGMLALGVEKWPLENRAEVDAQVQGEPVRLALEPRPPEELLRAALTAMKHGRPLMVVSAHARKPVQTDATVEPEARPPAPVKVELVSLSVLGALDPKVVRPELAAQLDALADCVDPDEDLARLPLAATLELSVDSAGRVLGVDVANKTYDAFGDCLQYSFRSDTAFSPPKKFGLSIVRAGLRFSAIKKERPGPP